MEPTTQRFTIELRRLHRDSYNLCCLCARFFQTGETAYLGYAQNGDPLHVGECCASKLRETAARLYWSERPYDLPNDNASLWRYMDFAKFVLLLQEKGLFFARADQFSDKFEGAKGVSANKTVWDDYYLRFFREAIRNPPPGQVCTLSNEEQQAEAETLLKNLEATGRRDLRIHFVSCWHQNEAESEALWRLYCPPPSTGVAIRTTYAALNQSLGDDPDIQIGEVRYIDYRKTFAGVNDAIFRKRRSLSHESEVRAVIRDDKSSDKLGLVRPVDLESLMENVVMSPFASGWFERALREMLDRFEVKAAVTGSEMSFEPFL